METKRNVILFMAISLDGYVAGPEGDLSFLTPMESEGEDYGYSETMAGVDTMILGRKTYDKVLSFGIPWPYAGCKTYVLSNTRTGSDEHVEYFGGDIAHLIAQIRSNPGKDIYLDGGGELVAQAFQRDLFDRVTVSLVPILLGDGIPLFIPGRPSQLLELERTLTFPSGLVQLRYVRKRA